MNAQELHDKLQALQQKQGYFFNPDDSYTMPLLESLLANRERYGYMACPCRLPSGTYELDADLICPCKYRKDDVAEYGACYCSLYVSQEWIDGTMPHRTVPERRPRELILKALGL